LIGDNNTHAQVVTGNGNLANDNQNRLPFNDMPNVLLNFDLMFEQYSDDFIYFDRFMRLEGNQTLIDLLVNTDRLSFIHLPNSRRRETAQRSQIILQRRRRRREERTNNRREGGSE